MRLEYRLDREEVAGWVLTCALKLPLLSPPEARCIGKARWQQPPPAEGRAWQGTCRTQEARHQHGGAAARGSHPQPGATATPEAEAWRYHHYSRRPAAVTAAAGAVAAAAADCQCCLRQRTAATDAATATRRSAASCRALRLDLQVPHQGGGASYIACGSLRGCAPRARNLG